MIRLLSLPVKQSLNSGKDVVLNVNTSDISKGLISFGESQNIIDEQLNNRSHTLVNIGANASVKNNLSDATGIRITGGTATTLSDIIVKGTVDVRNGTAILGNGNGIERVTLEGGSVYGAINLGKGDDILTANRGMIDGEIVMGRGSDTLILNPGIDITQLVKANGNDPMYSQADDEINQIQANGLHFIGYTSLAGNNNQGTNYANWDSITLNDGASLTLSGDLFESTEDRNRTLTINNTSSLLHQNGMPAIDRTIYGNLNNEGNVILSSNNMAGDLMTVTGNYTGK
ncbi:hypothetical protein [Budvicia aquatica]|uniref:Uncharacterized protein n=1 Tax=Budvicia aquatica TaxID=82979 RepID=A0A484ZJ97_9GAMM|nr:Uncharacterised protein [Budvicia aquatica]